jgi:predicted porin
MSAWEAGLAVDIAGARVGGNVLAGAMNGQMALKPDGAAHMIAYIVGAQYTMGPTTIGGSYMNIVSAGAAAASGAPLGSQRRGAGGQIGGTYVIGPGLISYLSAVYGQRYQGGVNLNTGLLSPAANNVKVLAAELGFYVRW